MFVIPIFKHGNWFVALCVRAAVCVVKVITEFVETPLTKIVKPVIEELFTLVRALENQTEELEDIYS